ncbi:E3 ubiquitin-protein ligase SINAT5-like [Musa acuminata AAA Group]|uniref:E3 ubiquitin-protein ligase SINAT5-like n=1 Tax=Musa acuminata AAA Group TaxID=214697 RepID=UPI0031D7F2B0
MLLNPNPITSLFSLIPLCMYSFSSPLPYDPSHGSPGGGGGEKASTWTLLRSLECMSLSVDMLDGEEVALVPNSLKPPGAGDDAAGGGSGLPATQITSNSRVNELLECPVCTNTMYPPIHQCRNGHTLCSSCKPRVQDQCPTCRQELGDIRCLALEKVAEFFELPCKYLSMGCPEIFPYYNKLKHEAQCNFRPYNCPYAGWECFVEGNIPFLVAHLRDDHKVDTHTGCTFNHRYVKPNPREVENATWMLTIFHCFEQHFCMHFEEFQLGMAPVYIVFLQFMGDENEAHNYRYRLEVGSNGRKLTWEGIPRSIRDSHQEVRDSHDGLIISRNMAIFFSGNKKDLKLRVTGRIWKEERHSDTGLSSVTL